MGPEELREFMGWQVEALEAELECWAELALVRGIRAEHSEERTGWR